MSRRKIKIDVWKYIRPILMGLGAVLEEKLDNQDRAPRPKRRTVNPEVGKNSKNRELKSTWI